MVRGSVDYTACMKSTSANSSILWIGHRGSPLHYPENTIEGYRAVLEAGGRYIETDVQLTADGVPFLYHDVELMRLSGTGGRLFDIDSETARLLPASFPERFGERFHDLCISPLADFSVLLEAYTDATAFIEIKEESAAHYGIDAVVDAVLATLDAVSHQCIFLSFDAGVVQRLQAVSEVETGWVIPDWNTRNREIAEVLNPRWLFCNSERLPTKNRDLWHGDWGWVLYTINDRDSGEALCKRGFRYLETDRILDMLHASR